MSAANHIAVAVARAKHDGEDVAAAIARAKRQNENRDLVGLGLRNPGLAAAILATAPPRYAPRHELVGGLLYCPVDRVHLPPTQPPPAPVRCRICGPAGVAGGEVRTVSLHV